MKKIMMYLSMSVIMLSGCTQLVTAPLSVAGSVVGTTIDVAGAAVDAATP